MIPKEFGQYSVVSYVNPLRGERINVGIAVWHPRFGSRFRRTDNLQRVACIDYDVDLVHVEHDLKIIEDTLAGWGRGPDSPLASLAARFHYDVVVTQPLNARVQDVDFLSERLWDNLIAPRRVRTESVRVYERDFLKDFSSFVRASLQNQSVHNLSVNFSEDRGGKPLRIAARFNYEDRLYVWRAAAFSPSDSKSAYLTRAKALTAENGVLRTIDEYKDSLLNIALKVPSKDAIKNWADISSWLTMNSANLIVYDDKRGFKPDDLLRPAA